MAKTQKAAAQAVVATKLTILEALAADVRAKYEAMMEARKEFTKYGSHHSRASDAVYNAQYALNEATEAEKRLVRSYREAVAVCREAKQAGLDNADAVAHAEKLNTELVAAREKITTAHEAHEKAKADKAAGKTVVKTYDDIADEHVKAVIELVKHASGGEKTGVTIYANC